MSIEEVERMMRLLRAIDAKLDSFNLRLGAIESRIEDLMRWNTSNAANEEYEGQR